MLPPKTASCLPLCVLLFLAMPVSAHNGAVAIAVPLEGITVDGDLSDWPDDLTVYHLRLVGEGDELRGIDDVRASFRVGYDGEDGALYAAVEVEDDSNTPAPSEDAAWNTQDGCEVYVAVGHTSQIPPIQYVMRADSYSAMRGKPDLSWLDLIRGMEDDFGPTGTGAAGRLRHGSDEGRTYEWRLDLNAATGGSLRLEPGAVIGLDVTVCDRDSDGSFSYMVWQPSPIGIRRRWASHTLGDLVLAGSRADVDTIAGTVVRQQGGETLSGVRVTAEEDRRWIRMHADTDGQGRYHMATPPGEYQVSLANARHGEPVPLSVRAGASVAPVNFAVTSLGPVTRVRARELMAPEGLDLKNWRCRLGDEMAWASPGFDDSEWDTMEDARPFPGEPSSTPTDSAQVAWFRVHLSVHESLWNQPLALEIGHAGAADVYLDGEQILTSRQDDASVVDARGVLRSRTTGVVFSPKTRHLIAVRYVDPSSANVLEQTVRGVDISLADLDTTVQQTRDSARASTRLRVFFLGVPLPFALLHLLLFYFYPRAREHLYFAIFTGCIAGMGYMSLDPDGSDAGRMHTIGTLLQALMLLSGLRFLYAVFYAHAPKRWRILAGVGAAAVVTDAFGWLALGGVLFVVLVLAAAPEAARVLVMAIVKKKDGCWLISGGTAVFAVAFVYSIFYIDLTPGLLNVGAGWDPDNPPIGLVPGVVGLLAFMSVYLARNVARTSRELEARLVEVEELSARSLAQERALRNEMEKELQTAHDLQLGLMPVESPSLDEFDIAGRCLTANHVGGDFYQYFPLSDGRQAISLADVTGHAMEAAIPAVMFSGILENQMESRQPLGHLLASLNRSLCRSLSEHTYVCLSMVEIDPTARTISLTNCGCPYPLHYHAATGEMSEWRIDAYPLGIRPGTLYEVKEGTLEPGDSLLLYSDGFPEAANADGDMFGFDHTAEVIRQGCSERLSPEELIDRLIAEVKAFTGGESQADDMTCVVVKVEE